MFIYISREIEKVQDEVTNMEMILDEKKKVHFTKEPHMLHKWYNCLQTNVTDNVSAKTAGNMAGFETFMLCISLNSSQMFN